MRNFLRNLATNEFEGFGGRCVDVMTSLATMYRRICQTAKAALSRITFKRNIGSADAYKESCGVANHRSCRPAAVQGQRALRRRGEEWRPGLARLREEARKILIIARDATDAMASAGRAAAYDRVVDLAEADAKAIYAAMMDAALRDDV